LTCIVRGVHRLSPEIRPSATELALHFTSYIAAIRSCVHVAGMQCVRVRRARRKYPHWRPRCGSPGKLNDLARTARATFAIGNWTAPRQGLPPRAVRGGLGSMLCADLHASRAELGKRRSPSAGRRKTHQSACHAPVCVPPRQPKPAVQTCSAGAVQPWLTRPYACPPLES